MRLVSQVSQNKLQFSSLEILFTVETGQQDICDPMGTKRQYKCHNENRHRTSTMSEEDTHCYAVLLMVTIS